MTLFSPTSPFPFTLSQTCLLKQTRKALSFPCPSFCLSHLGGLNTLSLCEVRSHRHTFFSKLPSHSPGCMRPREPVLWPSPWWMRCLILSIYCWQLVYYHCASWHLSEKNKQCPFKKQARSMWACAWMCIYFYATMKNEMSLKYFSCFWKEIQSNRNYYM